MNLIANRAVHVESSLRSTIDDVVKGSEELPSAIVANGRAAIAEVQRELVKAVGKVVHICFEEGVKRSLAQMLGYAREEAGVPVWTTHALPIGTRFVYHTGPHSLYVIEESPRIRTVLWQGRPVMLQFPFVIFLLYLVDGDFEVTQVFFRRSQLKTARDRLFIPALPDIISGGRPGIRFNHYICFPKGKVEMRGRPDVIAASAQEVFWFSDFRTDHWRRDFIDHWVTHDLTLDKWIKLTVEDPLSAIRLPWPESLHTIEDFASELKKQQHDGIKNSLARLDQYAAKVGGQLGGSIEEAVLDSITGSADVNVAKRVFGEQVKKAVDDAMIAEKVGSRVRSELEQACLDSGIDTFLMTTTKEASLRLQEVLQASSGHTLDVIGEKLGEKGRL